MSQPKKIVIVGLGLTGNSVLRYFQRKSIKQALTFEIKIIDTRQTPPGLEQLSIAIAQNETAQCAIEYCVGQWQMDWLLNADQIIVNPGLSLKTPELQQAITLGIEVIGDIELFARELNQSKEKIPVIGITGSNGKSTVTDLLGNIACKAGVDTGVGGNIGTPALDLLANEHSLYILELSSYQLETTHSLKLIGALFLNLAEDHMDRYQTMENYRIAKQRIFNHADCAVINGSDWATLPENNIDYVAFALNKKDLHPSSQKALHYYLLAKNDAEDYFLTVDHQFLLNSAHIALIGQHQLSNCLAALATVDLLTPYFPEINRTIAITLLTCYKGLKHRCQIIKECNGIRWINDSKATNVASTLAALSGLTISGNLHLFVGGDSKKAELKELQTVFSLLPSLQLYCYGVDGARFISLHPTAQLTETLEQAVALAMNTAKHGDTLLLSPACASLDQFKNFEARGDFFCQLADRY